MSLQGANYATPAQRAAFVQKLEERVRALPGVQQTAASNSLPVFGFNNSGSFRPESQPEPEPGQWPEVFFESVTPEYFETLGVRLVEGRTFTAADTNDKPDVSIINETMARRFWPNESAIGKRIGRPGQPTRWQEIIGVVNDMSFPARLGEPYTRFQCFRPVTQQAPFGGVIIALRTSVSPEGMAGALRGAAAELDPTQPVHRIRTARSLVDQGMGSISLLGSLLGAFAALGLALSAIGIYGVTAYSVAQRTGEIGIRMALGAQRKHVLWLVLSKGSQTILSGAVLGVGGAYGVSRLLGWLIPELPTRDNLALAATTLVLVAIALAACYLPARRATKVDPMIALRYE